MQKWEYCIFTAYETSERTSLTVSRHNKPPQKFQGQDRLGVLAELGQQGWELVAIHPLGVGLKEFYFKRPMR